MTAVWTFLNSPLGISLLVAIAGKLFASAVKNQSRREKILDYAQQAFQLAEMIGVRQGLGGNGKYLVYVEELVKGLAARKEAPLTADEKQLVDRLAYEKAWLAKPPTGIGTSPSKPAQPKPTALPLPPPPHG